MTTRLQYPSTNLKERIAALEQKNAESTASTQRATSPIPSVTSNSSHSGPPNGALRDRIARFEKKGGIPVPRGRFGLGAPPVVEGPRKRGELYGNRIPVSTRTVSGLPLPIRRPVSTSYDQRRSFSTSSVMSDFGDDHLNYSPMSSPTFTPPPDSPDSITSVSITPDVSPSLGDSLNPKQGIPRTASFARALEVARKAEIEKQERQNSTSLVSPSPSLPEDDSHVETPTETAPTIIISSEDVSPVVMPEISTVNVSVLLPTPIDGFSVEKVHLNEALSYRPPAETVIANDVSPVITTTTHNPLVEKEVARVGTPPLIIRKRAPTNPSTPSVMDKASKDPDINIVPIEPQVSISPDPEAVKLQEVSARTGNYKNDLVDSLPTFQPEFVEVDGSVPSENTELMSSVPEILPILPPPDIVILNEQSEENENVQELDDTVIHSSAQVRSRKLGLTLDSKKLIDGLPLQSVQTPHEAITAPPALHPFSTSLAIRSITSPDSFLSPPDTGLPLGSSSSGGSSLSSLGSRPMSMFETSPTIVTQLLRMTPATSRGVPIFLPASQELPRKSDFPYFPPTPENEDTDLTTQKLSHPTRTRSGSDPEDTRKPSKPTFSAVVHRKVRETPASATAPDNKPRPLPQTPRPQRVKGAPTLETPFSPGHGELTALLQEAVLLENTLNKGELPSEESQLEEQTQQEEKGVKEAAAATAQAKAQAQAEEEERNRIALAAAQLQNKRDEPTSGRLKHTFLVPLSKVRSRRRKEVYTAKAETFFSASKEPPVPSTHPEIAGLPSQSTHSLPMASDTNNSTTQLPTKSAKSPTFSSLRKFGSVSRATAGGGASARTSHSISSEVSSEESSSVATADEFGHGTRSTLSFPSVSPKKASNTIARATSFAERLWSRGRTKSSGSTLSSTSEVNDRVVDDPPAKTPVLGIPTLPRHPEVPSLSLDEPSQIIPLRRSTSSKRSAVYFSPALDLTAVPQLPLIVPDFQLGSQTTSSLFLPVSNEFARPCSANSLSSSIGSLPSPLFGQELVDAFPSVPDTTPPIIGQNFLHRETSLAPPAATSFDTALLSSAIHLTSTYKTTTPKARSNPLPTERAATPTYNSRQSGDMVR